MSQQSRKHTLENGADIAGERILLANSMASLQSRHITHCSVRWRDESRLHLLLNTCFPSYKPFTHAIQTGKERTMEGGGRHEGGDRCSSPSVLCVEARSYHFLSPRRISLVTNSAALFTSRPDERARGAWPGLESDVLRDACTVP